MATQLFPLLCGFATVIFAASTRQLGQGLYWLAGFLLAGFLVGAWSGPNIGYLLLDPAQVATVLVLAALLKFQTSRFDIALLVFSGLIAAIWANSLILSGYPGLPVTAVVVVLSALTVGCSVYRKEFVTEKLLDEALLILLLMALFIAIVPAAIAGWQSASGLQGLDASQGGTAINGGVLVIVLAFAVLGGVYKKWKDNRVV
jgi:hypothetical protein